MLHRSWQLTLLIGAALGLGSLATVPAHASSAATTTPKSLREEWFYSYGHAGMGNIKITAKTFREVSGGMGHHHGLWGDTTAKTCKLGKKAKVNTTVVFAKHANEHGYWKVAFRDRYNKGNQYIYLKRIKSKGEYKLARTIDSAGRWGEKYWIPSAKKMKYFKTFNY